MVLGRPSLLLEGRILRSFVYFNTFAKNMFAVAQLTSSQNKSENLRNVVNLITEAANKGAKVCPKF